MGPLWKTNDCWAAKTKTPSNMVKKELKTRHELVSSQRKYE